MRRGLKSSRWWPSILREPLVHFLCAGALLFLVFHLRAAPEAGTGDSEIKIDRDTILNFMQYRAKAFRSDLFLEKWTRMTEEQRRALIEDYVHEEALFREARSMGLREGDYVIRRRMIQRLNFLIDDAVAELPAPAETDLADYFSRHKEEYREQAIYTFTHVFFDSSRHGATGSRKMAELALHELNLKQVQFNEATEYGDRFPYFQNYVERRADFVESHFGHGMLSAMDGITIEGKHWTGPYQSPHGWHLVLLIHRTPTRIPEASNLRALIMEDFLRERRDSERRKIIEKIISRYAVRMAEDLTG